MYVLVRTASTIHYGVARTSIGFSTRRGRKCPELNPVGERVAVHARQLALEPDLQIIRRSRRPLLRGLEQARRSALAHHVHRIAPMGARVLINGIRYYSTACGGKVDCRRKGCRR